MSDFWHFRLKINFKDDQKYLPFNFVLIVAALNLRFKASKLYLFPMNNGKIHFSQKHELLATFDTYKHIL